LLGQGIVPHARKAVLESMICGARVRVVNGKVQDNNRRSRQGKDSEEQACTVGGRVQFWREEAKGASQEGRCET
jgi:hypothetical protein